MQLLVKGKLRLLLLVTFVTVKGDKKERNKTCDYGLEATR